MKRKIGLLVLALALAGTLVACGNKNASVNPTAPAVAPTDSAAPNASPKPNNNIVGKADNAMRNAGNAARNAMDDMGAAARDAMEKMDETGSTYPYSWNGDVAADGYNGYAWGAYNGAADYVE